ncbi:hypothetical protein LCGC14_1664660 [marine sediment metagenome]|uniref:Uncharacterized protein n=1 Tax=marine sediment metagenome TaxID=412755 RepID=A0A0F9IFQ9_9ZZZZ|nr:hypothetical protein [Phycisphaerae bacterium]HDZ44265.1 hypothetical protein [Phycisphaerae bacterium]
MATATTETERDIPQGAKQAAEAWKMPPVKLGDKILFAPDLAEMKHPESRGRCMGFVTKIGRRTVDVLCLVTGGFRPRMSCRHVDDPLLPLNPQWLEEPDTGVFQPADSEVQLKRLQATVDSLQVSVASLLGKKKA